MGLLDEAIRDHLELKRRRGADPSEVARQEHEVLGAPRRDHRDDEPPPAAPVASNGADETAARSWLSEPPEADAGPDPRAEAAAHGPETAELDMGPLLREERPPEPHTEEPAPSRDEHAPAPAPGMVSRPSATGAPDTDERAGEEPEDVLGETPDFLQDTPEHDRLWFEQQPPRDFDFDR